MSVALDEIPTATCEPSEGLKLRRGDRTPPPPPPRPAVPSAPNRVSLPKLPNAKPSSLLLRNQDLPANYKTKRLKITRSLQKHAEEGILFSRGTRGANVLFLFIPSKPTQNLLLIYFYFSVHY